ncbi:MAG: hypothetical protein ACLVF8_02065 [Parabacteroides merdae]
MIYISSLVIVFHRRKKYAGQKNGKCKGKSKEKHRIRGVKEGIGTQTENSTQEKTAGTESETVESGRNGTKPTKKKLYYAELGASCL